MKRTGHLMEQITNLDNLYLAYQKACRGKHGKKEVLLFAESFDLNIQTMRSGLLDGTISVGNYHFFTIHDPKERIICAASFPERVLQHAIMNVCHPVFDRVLIDSTYAARKGKGVYAALDYAVKAMTRYKYSVKMDVRRYYDSIDHDVLKCKLRRILKDKELLMLMDKIIDSYELEKGKGLPIGNLMSQYFANLYLSALDHKAKEKWKIPVYIRYMDDILIAADDRMFLRQCVDNLMKYSSEELELTLKPPVFSKAENGQIFLGYRVLPFHYKLSGRSKKRFRSKWLEYNRLLEVNEWTERQYAEHILPLFSFARHAESLTFRKTCLALSD